MMTDAELLPLLGLTSAESLQRQTIHPAARIVGDVRALIPRLRCGRLHQQDAQDALAHLTAEARALPLGWSWRLATAAVMELAREVAK